ncbi:MAG TPA: glycoside hydrolase family 57 protein [Candidatus Thermoplasmatota archaeon]|jgi:alpha-amylase|nr:glycoside hydrolase family 57 protein [Candidatus Thermoplasmatota archaeon]
MLVTLYFQVHQPWRLKPLRSYEPVADGAYWDVGKNQGILDRVAKKCYLPANAMLEKLLDQHGEHFRFAFSLSGTFLEQCRELRPDVLESFQRLARRPQVEILGETYYHSLTGLWDDPSEFEQQARMHRELMRELFGRETRVFRNTELIYDNRIAAAVKGLGFQAILTEGTEKILHWRQPTYVYESTSGLPILLKHYRLSDDVAFRFHDPNWNEYPLTADKYAKWLALPQGDVINLMMDYETFGEHKWAETGIFQFLEHFPGEALRAGNHFLTPSEAIARLHPRDKLDVPFAISWADVERDVSAWLGNEMQQEAFNQLRHMKDRVLQTKDPQLIGTWRRLTTSDHVYYCSTKAIQDQDIHAYFSPYESPYLAFIYLMNAIRDLDHKVQTKLAGLAAAR